MEVKIDTKEKMHVITIVARKLAANMAADIKNELLFYLGQPIKNVVLSFENVDGIEQTAAFTLLNIQQAFYDAGSSMVFCNFHADVEKYLEQQEFLEEMNVTPTISEAGDIVQMEEIEREFL